MALALVAPLFGRPAEASPPLFVAGRDLPRAAAFDGGFLMGLGKPRDAALAAPAACETIALPPLVTGLNPLACCRCLVVAPASATVSFTGQSVAQCRQRHTSVGTLPRVHSRSRAAAALISGGPRKNGGGRIVHEQLRPQ